MDQNIVVAPKKSYGAMIGIIIIIILLAVGAFYVWGSKLSGGASAPKSDDLTSLEQDSSAPVDVNTDMNFTEATDTTTP